MSPSPGIQHQDLSINLAREFSIFFKGKKCRPFAAPLDVKLSERDIVQPDLLVVCNPQQFKGTHIEGTPRLLVEIVSPSSESRDRLLKMKLYEKYGVGEYWVVTPYPPLVEIFVLEAGRFHLHSGGSVNDIVSSPAFPGLKLKLSELFDLHYTEEERKIFEVREPPSKYST